jgi:phosphoenolpyruvate carboxylase
MNVLTKKELSIVSYAITRAQFEIQQQVGIDVVLVPRYPNKLVEDELKQLFEAMCEC